MLKLKPNIFLFINRHAYKLIKSADPVTYDDKGNVIPLSQRFNSENDDIRYALPDEVVEKVDASWYNEVSLPSSGYSRIESEALTWDVENKNQIRTRTLSNGITYRYIIDDDNIVHVIDRFTSENIHIRREHYDNTSRKRPNNAVEIIRSRQGNNGVGSNTMQNRREQTKNDRRDNSALRQQGDSNRARYTENRVDTDRRSEARVQGPYKSNRKKLVGFHENTDGTVTYEYSDKTIEVKAEDGNVIYSGKKSGYKKASTNRYALSNTDEAMTYKAIFGDMEKVDFDKIYYKDRAAYWKAERDTSLHQRSARTIYR